MLWTHPSLQLPCGARMARPLKAQTYGPLKISHVRIDKLLVHIKRLTIREPAFMLNSVDMGTAGSDIFFSPENGTRYVAALTMGL